MINVNVDLELPGARLIKKIWKTIVDNGIGGWLRPGQMRREGRALSEVRAERIMMIAQAEKDAEDIRAGRKRTAFNLGGQLVAVPQLNALPNPVQPGNRIEPFAILPQSEDSFDVEPVLSESALREIQRTVNIHRIALYAEEQGRDVPDEEVSAEPIDNDWLNAWRECAQDVTDEYMRQLWGRILADESKAPGTYRMRTLDFLRTLDKSDAKRIEALGPYVLDLSWIHIQDETFVLGKGPTFDELLDLQDLGIVAGVGVQPPLLRQFVSKSRDKFLNWHSCGSKAISIERDAADPPFQLPIYRLTALGRDVLRLGEYQANDDYLGSTGLAIKRQGFRVWMGPWIRKPNADSTWGRLGPDAIEL